MKEYGRRFYVSDIDYQQQMRKPVQPIDAKETVEKQSEFKKPYRAESYAEMEHFRDPPPGINVDYPELPDIPGVDQENPAPPDNIIFQCSALGCYCPGGEEVCVVCNQRIVRLGGMSDLDKIASAAIKGNVICVTGKEDAGSPIYLEIVCEGPDHRIGHPTAVIDNCSDFECETCDCTGAGIGYTTLQMVVNGTQTLTVTGAAEGCTYTWAIIAGAGSLSVATGLSTVYTAPATNANCVNNPTIQLSCNGTPVATLELAVNAVANHYQLAYVYGQIKTGPYCSTYGFCIANPTWGYACDGYNMWYSTGDAALAPCYQLPKCPHTSITYGAYCCEDIDPREWVWSGYCFLSGLKYCDKREGTAGLLAAGCCPSVAL